MGLKKELISIEFLQLTKKKSYLSQKLSICEY